MCVDPECSEDEEDEDFGQDFLPSPPSATSCPSPGLNLLALSVSVDTTRLSMILPINNTGKVLTSTLLYAWLMHV